MGPTTRTPFALLALGGAALFSSWNPASAPLALVVGLLAGALWIKAWREVEHRSPAWVAAGVVAALAVVASLAVVVRTTWAGRSSDGTPIVEPVPRTERSEALDRAAESTRPAREAARKELESVQPKR